jgi:hypothetical protein
MLQTVGAVANNTVLDKLHDEDVKVNRFRLRLAAAQCGKPMAFRLPPPLLSFLRPQPQEKNLGARAGKAEPFRTVWRQSRFPWKEY